MKNLTCTLTFIGMLITNLYGQTIIADPLSGCDSLTVRFGLHPATSYSEISNISWSFSNGITIEDEFYPLVKFDAPGEYSVSCVINNSVILTETDMILVYSGPCEDILEIPNVFSPNGDGINDYFKIRTNGINIYSLSIYTKSGVMVFKTESPEPEWDGRTLSGQELSQGIYYYIVKQVDGEENREKTGFLHLIR